MKVPVPRYTYYAVAGAYAAGFLIGALIIWLIA